MMKYILILCLLASSVGFSAQYDSVMTGGTQTITGVKFVPTPALSNQVANKAYVDANSGGAFTNLFKGPTSTGLVASVSSDAGKFLRADGAWGNASTNGQQVNLFKGTGTQGLFYTLNGADILQGTHITFPVSFDSVTYSNQIVVQDSVTIYLGTNYVQYTGSTNFIFTIYTTNNILTVVNSQFLAGSANLVVLPGLTIQSGTNTATQVWDFTGATLLGINATGGGTTNIWLVNGGGSVTSDTLDITNTTPSLLTISLASNGGHGRYSFGVGSGVLTNSSFTINGQAVTNGASLVVTAGDGLTTNDVVGITTPRFVSPSGATSTVWTIINDKIGSSNLFMNGSLTVSNSATITGVGSVGTLTVNNNATVSGNMSAGTFTGNGSGLSITLAGDVSGSVGSTTVGKLQGRSVDSASPGVGGFLVWDGSKWVSTNVAPAQAIVTNSFILWLGDDVVIRAPSTAVPTSDGLRIPLVSTNDFFELMTALPLGWLTNNANLYLEFLVPNTSQATGKVSVSIMGWDVSKIGEMLVSSYPTGSNLSFVGSGVLSNRVSIGPINLPQFTNGVPSGKLGIKIGYSSGNTGEFSHGRAGY